MLSLKYVLVIKQSTIRSTRCNKDVNVHISNIHDLNLHKCNQGRAELRD